jgi:hypothetical protein
VTWQSSTRAAHEDSANPSKDARMEKLFELLGLGTPFLYAGATFALFQWLDSNASEEAKAAFSRLLYMERYDNNAISAALIELFDRIYTHPLLTGRAFIRSAMITIVVSVVYLYEIDFYRHFKNELPSIALESSLGLFVGIVLWFGLMLFINIVSDFCSLFIVRRWLVVAGHRPIAALVISSLIAFVVFAFSFVFRLGFEFIILVVVPYLVFGVPYKLGLTIADMARGLLFAPGSLLLPALVVFSWLPLFGVSLATVRALSALAPMVRQIQWLLKGGREQPLSAVGYVAAVIVFLGTILWRHLHGDVQVMRL